ncbi:hypothetical protein IQ06DRAFT_23090 [Phaeosphaeriaceae sp. SRC1lsM3a]|nr:hypothetical protein IQ06DRAFT_23090 [Stagonospora sp. SRC1lsM3a]
MRMKKQGVIPASSSNNGLAAIRLCRSFSFEMIPRRIRSTAMNENCYSSFAVTTCVITCLAYPARYLPIMAVLWFLGYTTGAD